MTCWKSPHWYCSMIFPGLEPLVRGYKPSPCLMTPGTFQTFDPERWMTWRIHTISRVHFVGYWNLLLHHALHCLACVDWYWSIPFRSEWIESSHPNEYQLTVWPVFWNVNGRGAGLGQTQPLQISIESVFVLEYIYMYDYIRIYIYMYTYAH